MRWFFVLMLFFPMWVLAASKPIVNVYAWSGEVSDSVIRQFENSTGIKVNFSTYDNNEVMYAKLRTTKGAGYDVILPSSYFVERMRKQNMLLALDKKKLSNWKNLNSTFLNPPYDPGNEYSVPNLWGVTGIFVNKKYFDPKTLSRWVDLWEPRFNNTLMALDDTRELFSIALLTLGYSPNDQNPEHIKAAYEKLKTLLGNIKVFSSDTVVSIIIDEDATVGTAWNGDVYKAIQENPDIDFIFPKEGFVIWVDTFAIPKNAPHVENAYAFINFMLRADIAETTALETSFPIANSAGQKLLPAKIRNNPVIYPPPAILRHGQFQKDLDERTLRLYEKYWENLKMGG